jgi:HSP20 family protein
MAIARWTPIGELSNLNSAMDRLFGELLQGGMEGGPEGSLFRLPVDITESEKGYQIKAPIPGFKPEEVEVSHSDGVLTIMARHAEEKPEKKENYVRREVRRVDYIRQIALPSDIRAEDIKASFENGELVVDLPRAARPKPMKINVERKHGEKEKAQQPVSVSSKN